VWLTDGEKSVLICLAVLIQHETVILTDGQFRTVDNTGGKMAVGLQQL